MIHVQSSKTAYDKLLTRIYRSHGEAFRTHGDRDQRVTHSARHLETQIAEMRRETNSIKNTARIVADLLTQMVNQMTYQIPANSKGSFCAGCNARIFWAKTDAGKWIPVDTDLKPHWATCPVAKRFRKPKKEQS